MTHALQKESTHHYVHSKNHKWTTKVMPGEFYVSEKDEMLITVLGSCIAACIYDESQHLGGMNHFMLPHSESGAWAGNISHATRYGNYAMEHMINELIKKGSQTAVEALSHGAIDVVGKPSHDASLMQECTRDIIQKITEASRARVGQKAPVAPAPLPEAFISQEKTFKIDEVMPSVSSNYLGKPIIAIASSTGGPQVLKEILAGVDSPNTPPIVIVQHIGVGFSEALARSIDKISPLNVIHAQNGQLLKRGNVYFAPAGMHMGVVSEKEYYKIKLYDLERVNRHKPSADVLFRTLNTVAGKKALSFVLTGMGDDGAMGLKELHMSGAQSYVQNEESCTVYGMPRAALALEPQHGALTVSQIIKKIKEYVS